MTQNEEFDIDLEKNIQAIQEVLFKEENGDKIKNVFQYYQSEFSPLLIKEYLSHIVSAMERLVRNLTNNEVFVVEFNEIQVDDKKHARAMDIFSSETDDNLSAFIINYPKISDHTLLRIGIAHELGHLFEEIVSRQYNRNIIKDEEVCSLFALVVIADRSNFYKYVSSQYAPSLIQILNKISFLHENRTNSSVNLSGKTFWSQ